MSDLLPYDGPEIATVTAEFLVAVRRVMDDLPGTVVADAEHSVRFKQEGFNPSGLQHDERPVYVCHALITFVVKGMEQLNIEALFHQINADGMEGKIQVSPGAYELRMYKRYVR